jgi:hypothetical protein
MELDRDNPLAAEIRREIAQSYFAACKRMVDSLEELKTSDRAAASRTLDEKQIVRRSELLEEAGERVYFVVIQREAMGLSTFEEFFGDYEIPNEVRARLRPKR